MASLESHAASLEDSLIPQLSFKFGPSSSYVIERRGISLYAAGSNIYSAASGTRVVRIPINAESSFIDPSSATLFFRVNNNDATTQTSTNITRMQALGQAHVFFKSARILLQGQVAEEIQDFGRVYEQLLRLTDPQYQKQYAAQSFGLQDSSPEDYFDLREARKLKPGTSKTVGLPLSIFGLFGQHRFLPTGLMNMVLELTLQDPALCCRAGNLVDGSLTTTHTTNDITLDAFVLKVDALTLDSQLMEEYNRMALTKTIPLSYKTWHHTSFTQSGEQNEVTVSLQRALSRLCTVFVTLFSPSGSPAVLQECNYFPSPVGQINSVGQVDYPFMHTDVIDDAKSVGYQFVCNGDRYPTAPVETLSKAYYRMVLSLGFGGQTSHSIPLQAPDYATTNFVICESFEKINGSELSGKNLRGGSTLQINLKGLVQPGMLQTDKITKIFALCQYSAVAEISAQGVTILE